MNKFIGVLLCSALFCQTAFSECLKPVQYTLVGTPAACTGYLFSPEKELELRLTNEDYKVLKEELELKSKMLDNYKKQVNNLDQIYNKEMEKSELWRIRAEQSTQKLFDAEAGRGNRDFLFLVGGVVLTVAAGYALNLASQ